MSTKHLQSIIENFINGNLSDARKQAKQVSQDSILDTLREEYGYTIEKALLTARYLKTGEGFQAACDCE